eukprot:CAMPEP_0170211448 /NCGR_PEP_ID=MMETSP0116_2-20130129/5340_1 /TAXON_ID=400756 /ORGANISM="Durinskia baltica, Strain CSIRO CS-38" /LENGTH=54 /DNA_ID=CAMNT_0010461983 /DNA_START=150 /DNA_END=311 /DNA_ORIENTATION=+
MAIQTRATAVDRASTGLVVAGMSGHIARAPLHLARGSCSERGCLRRPPPAVTSP